MKNKFDDYDKKLLVKSREIILTYLDKYKCIKKYNLHKILNVENNIIEFHLNSLLRLENDVFILNKYSEDNIVYDN